MTSFRAGTVLVALAAMLASAAISHAGTEAVTCVCGGHYNVGDRVRALVDNPQGNADIVQGSLGTVEGGRVESGADYLLITWDMDVEAGHDGLSECQCPTGCSSTAPRGWYVGCSEITLENCGNGTVEVGEECDDYNVVDGDCCQSSCDRPDGCLSAGRSTLYFRNVDDNSKDKLIWKWNRGAAVTLAEFGDMTTVNDYVFCLNGTKTTTIDFDPHWTLGTENASYEDPALMPTGISTATFKAGEDGQSKLSIKGSGENLPDLKPGTLKVYAVATLVRPGICFQAAFWGPKETDSTIYKAVSHAP